MKMRSGVRRIPPGTLRPRLERLGADSRGLRMCLRTFELLGAEWPLTEIKPFVQAVSNLTNSSELS